jgi:AcrR family transcriptional regulator
VNYNCDRQNKINTLTKNVDYAKKQGKPLMKVCESDPRSIRTREQLRQALMSLAAEKNFASLTIQDVTDLAGLNRTTFYLHYGGLHELLEDCARTLFAQMRTEIYANKVIGDVRNTVTLTPFVESVFRHLEQHEKFYRAMLGRQGDPLFRGLFQELLLDLIFEPIARQTQGDFSDPQLEMNIRFFNAGFTGLASWWLEKGKPIPIEQASLQFTRDILPGYLRLMSN